MPQFQHRSELTHPRQDVAHWHQLPGALVRATPHWAGRVLVDTPHHAVIKVAVPGFPGRYPCTWRSKVVARDDWSLTDAMVRGPLRRWVHTHAVEESALVESIDYQLLGGIRIPKRFFQALFDERARRITADLSFQHRYATSPRTVVVAGASGLVGQQVVALLRTGGHTVRSLVRRTPVAPGEYQWDPVRGQLDEAALAGADAVIHLGGASIGTRFTAKNKQRIRDSRVQSTALLARAVAKGLGPSVFVVASASGFYGAQRPGEILHEGADPGADFLAQVCQQWEAAADPARAAGVRVVHVRTGVVLSPLGGALALQLPAFLAGVGGHTGTGQEQMSWISLDDIAGVYVHALLTESLAGPVNAVGPEPATTKQVATAVGRALRRPAILPVPRLATDVVLGREGTNLIALSDQHLSAATLVASGYQFFDPTLELCACRALNWW